MNNKLRFNKLKIVPAVLAIAMLVMCLGACGTKEPHMGKAGPLPVHADNDETDSSSDNICIIQELNMLEETVTVYDTISTRVLRYKYSLATRFLDKYGGESSSYNFTPGTAVVLGDRLKSNALSSITMSDKTWTQTNVTKYSIDSANNKMTIGSATYRYNDFICVYSGNEAIAVSSIGDVDTLTVVGLDNNILSIAVTTGHGYIQFINTAGFDGSMVQIGSKIFTKVTPDMLTEVPEGSYDVTVANNGYGDTVKCDVTKGEISVIDLSAIQNRGEKSCKLTFVVSDPNVNLYLDGNQVAANQELSVPYGVHFIRVSASGYDDWSKTLYVNSPSAKIAVDMSDNSSSSSNSTNTTANTTANSTNKSNRTSNTTAAAALSGLNSNNTDYLSTISNMISTLTGSN